MTPRCIPPVAEIVIELPCGPVTALETTDGLRKLRGVPFAQAPQGPLVDQPPQPLEAWTAPRSALDCAPAPLQPKLPGLGMRRAERISADCLYLNVDAPANPDSPVPVMVWVFGGGYITGDASDELFDGSNLARSGLVVVRANYRLGAFGRNNLGMQDQLAALHWVQENIAALGGDPDNVTLFGESAGAMSICNLLTMPRARGLFHAAIAQSGAGNNVSTLPAADLANRRWDAECKALPDPQDVDARLDTQQRLNKALRPTTGGMPFRPVIDGELLPQHPEEAAHLGADIPLLIGQNADEHRLYLHPRLRPTEDDLRTLLSKRATMARLSDIKALYPDHSTLELLASIETELRYRQPMQRYANARGANTWVYRFNWRSPALRGWLAACHAIEIPFVFGNFQASSTVKFVGPGYADLSAEMMALWRHFAYHHEPPEVWMPHPQVLDIHPGFTSRGATATELYWDTLTQNHRAAIAQP